MAVIAARFLSPQPKGRADRDVAFPKDGLGEEGDRVGKRKEKEAWRHWERPDLFSPATPTTGALPPPLMSPTFHCLLPIPPQPRLPVCLRRLFPRAGFLNDRKLLNDSSANVKLFLDFPRTWYRAGAGGRRSP